MGAACPFRCLARVSNMVSQHSLDCLPAPGVARLRWAGAPHDSHWAKARIRSSSRRCVAWLLRICLPLLVAASAGATTALDAPGLTELAQLARLGAPQLALRRMDAEQPGADQNLVEWMAWEQERLQILHRQGMHRELVERLTRLPDAADEHFLRLALSLKADALLQLGEAVPARATARELLWFHNSAAEPKQLESWRRLVVRSYVLEDRNEDAGLALLRYRQDFGEEASQWRWLNARVMLQSGRAEAAFGLLENDRTPEGRLLRMAAELAAFPDRAASLETAAAKAAKETKLPELQGAYWALAARAARGANKPFDELRYLENSLSLPSQRELTHALLDLDADYLWESYLGLGKQIGNQEQRLIGSDEDWFFPATEALEKDPLRARVLFSVLVEFGSDAESRSVAHGYLVGMLDELPNGRALVRRLYLESARYSDIRKLPPVIRHRLIDEALEAGELQTASRLMQGFTASASGSDALEWDLRRARIHIYTGEMDAGARVLERLLSAQDQQWDSQRIDRVLQVVLDLQTVEQHQQALLLFSAMLAKPLDAQQGRELLFWMADSLRALEKYDEAAYLYLKSATLQGTLAMDPWAQTARYQAAKTLAEAGLVEDARQIYGSLLGATHDISRRAVLENEIQRLHLVKAAWRKGD